MIDAAEHAEVAEGGPHSRRSPVDHRDLVAGALQETGAAHPDDPRPDYRDAARGGHPSGVLGAYRGPLKAMDSRCNCGHEE